MTGQKDNGTVTLSPTDYELGEIFDAAFKEVCFDVWATSAGQRAGRRALYDAGMRAVIEHIEKNHGLDECVCTGCLREELLGEGEQ